MDISEWFWIKHQNKLYLWQLPRFFFFWQIKQGGISESTCAESIVLKVFNTFFWRFKKMEEQKKQIFWASLIFLLYTCCLKLIHQILHLMDGWPGRVQSRSMRGKLTSSPKMSTLKGCIATIIHLSTIILPYPDSLKA